MPGFRNWARFLPTPAVRNLASLGPLGYTRTAPGTIASVAGLVWYTVIFVPLGPLAYILVLCLSIYIAIEICDEAERRLLKRDPSEIVLDEFVAVPLCFLGLDLAVNPNRTWILMLLGFCLYRLLDILKPLAIGRLERLPGGLGIVVDDLVAAAATCALLHLFAWKLHPFLLL